FQLSDKAKFQAIKGVRDILPPESALWNRVEQSAREVFGTFGFAEIRLPIFEFTGLFKRSIGLETDVVSKEMYTIPDEETAHIYGLQHALVEWRIKDGDFNNAESFRGLVTSLLVFIADAHEESLLRLEEVGVEALNDLVGAEKDLRDLISRSSHSKDDDNWHTLNLLVERIRLAS